MFKGYMGGGETLETGRKIKDAIDDKQTEMMEGFMKMVSLIFGEYNCKKWYDDFLNKDESFLDQYKKDQYKKGGE